MRVSEVMTNGVCTCRCDDALATVARLMWDHDVGAVPIVGADGTVEGLATDRDLCMAALFSGEPLWATPVGEHLRKMTFTITPEDTVDEALELMRSHRIRRLPVVDEEARPIGMLALADLVRAASQGRRGAPDAARVVAVLAEISQARAARAPRHLTPPMAAAAPA